MSDSIPRLFTPEEIGDRLGRSAYWVKKQCRLGLFPHTWSSGAYRFTSGHFAEILRVLERRPSNGQRQGNGGTVRRRATPTSGEPVVHLRARRPRRSKGA